MSTPSALARNCRAEWSRIWSVRSSWVLALLTTVAVVGVGALIGQDTAADADVPPDVTAWDGGRLTGMFALFGWSLALFYHMLNGLRHLVWDTGRLFAVKNANAVGLVILVTAAALTAALWLCVGG